jgi:hypothetical protein
MPKELIKLLPSKIWEDYDASVGGYISKKDLVELITNLNS